MDYLLKREQVRQNIKLNTETQLRIFRKLMRLMTEFNITAESKDTIKDLIKSYNQKILQSSLKEYISEQKPSMEDLVETLSNHVFLDRKPNGDIGFVNDFIFGLLVGDNLILKKYEEYYPKIDELLPQDFASKAVQSFKIQSVDRRIMLFEEFNSKPFNFESKFFFNLEYSYLNKFSRQYNNLYIDDIELNDISFDVNQQFIECGFSNITFNNCIFHLKAFSSCTFTKWTHYKKQKTFVNNSRCNIRRNKMKATSKITCNQTGVFCFVEHESAKSEVKFFIGSSFVLIPDCVYPTSIKTIKQHISMVLYKNILRKQNISSFHPILQNGNK